MKVYQELARYVDARLTCIERGSTDWTLTHKNHIQAIVKQYMPSGSGIDRGTAIDLDASTGDKLVFDLGFHHINEGGFYDGWTEHRITVRPSLIYGFTLSISGSNRNDIKESLYQDYQCALDSEVQAEPANP